MTRRTTGAGGFESTGACSARAARAAPQGVSLSGSDGTCPRISPAVFFGVWTFTYVRPVSSAARAAAFRVAVPRAPLRHGPQSGTATGPAFPRAPMWMCAAMARPVRRENVSRQAMAPVVPDFVTVPVNRPTARRTLPFGLGRYCRAERLVAIAAETPSCPRISPALFVGVCTFVYAPPLSSAASTVSEMFAVPLAGL